MSAPNPISQKSVMPNVEISPSLDKTIVCSSDSLFSYDLMSSATKMTPQIENPEIMLLIQSPVFTKTHIFKWREGYSKEHFLAFLLKDRVTPHHTRLLDHCSSYHPETVSFKQIEKSTTYDSFLIKPLKNLPKIEIVYKKEFYTYKTEEFYQSFASRKSLGGGYRMQGNVQEERLFWEFFDLAGLDFMLHQSDKTKDALPCVNGTEARPVIFLNQVPQFDISGIPYGGGMSRGSMTPIRIGDAQDAPYVNIISMAAWDCRGDEIKKYSLEMINYLFDAAYLGYVGAKNIAQENNRECVIHTGRWGCGLFQNSEKMIATIQYLAARMAGVNCLHLHDVKNGNTFFNEETIKSLIKDIDQKIAEERTAMYILQWMEEQQKDDPSWRPWKR